MSLIFIYLVGMFCFHFVFVLFFKDLFELLQTSNQKANIDDLLVAGLIFGFLSWIGVVLLFSLISCDKEFQ